MSKARERFRRVLSSDTCTVAANIFDPLSARIAEMLNYEVCFLSGSVGKAANLGYPDLVMYNMSDAVDYCRRITRMADVSLMLDGEDGFGNAVNTIRTVREFESAGVSAIEIEDSIPPDRFNGSDPGLYSKEEQISKLTAAVFARTDPGTVIVARTAALSRCQMDEALARIAAYSETGVEAIRLTGLKTRQQLVAVHGVTDLPLTTLSPPSDLLNDRSFLAANGLRILMLGNPAFSVAVKGIYDCLKHLKDGGSLENVPALQASSELLREVSRTDELIQLQEQFLWD
ncbi:MAG: isocitrate lyase/PEP mutase family protein [Chloroflexota bacterium]|nr:isocitrate lyase/PEP mutase family protein [Chloroflexota bacterium]